MAPFIRNNNKSGESSAAAAPEAAQPSKKPSKMKRLLNSARKKKKHGGSFIIPKSASSASLSSAASGGNGNGNGNGRPPKIPLSVMENGETIPHSNTAATTIVDTTEKPPKKKQSQLSLPEIVELLKVDIEVRDRKYHLKIFDRCFVGSEVVDYLVQNDLATSRSAAVQMGRELLGDLGMIEHVSKDADFKDDYLFYRFVEETTRKSETVPNYKRISSTGDGSQSSSGHGGNIIKMDKYGFLLEDDRCLGADNNPNSENDTNDSPRRSAQSDAKRWERLLDKINHKQHSYLSSSFSNSGSNLVGSYSTSSQSKVKYYARKGLPDSLRQKAWTVLTGVDLIMAENAGEYDALVFRADEEYRKMHDHESGDLSLDGGGGGDVHNDGGTGAGDGKSESSRAFVVLETIERDIHRTFPKHYLFHTVHDDSDDEDQGYNGRGSTSKNAGEDCSSVCDSENAGSDYGDYDNVEGEEVDAGEDDIVQLAASTGQDPSKVVEEKKRLFNDSMSTLMNSMNCGVDLQGIDEATDELGNVKESFYTGGSDNSLDIFDEEEESDDNGAPMGRKDSTKSGKSSSDALGMGRGQGALRRVLRAYSMYDSEVGYCQGMNFITAMFLTFLSEEEAFWLLVVVMNEEPYKLRELFGEDMAGTHEVLYIAEKLLAQFLPKLSKHIETEGIHISMFVTQWLLTLYTSTFPFELVARVWDSFLVEGWKVVYRVMLSLLEYASKDLLEMRFEDILHFFRDYPSTVNGPVIMAGSLKIALKRKHIQKHVNEWRRHSGNGSSNDKETKESKSKDKWNRNRRVSGDSSVSSGTMNSHGDRSLLKLVPPKNFLKQNVLKEIEVENISEQLLPILGRSKFAVMLHNVLTPEECSVLIDQAEEHGFEDASIYNHHTNKVHRSCERYVSDDFNLAENWYERIVHALKDTQFERRLMSASWLDINRGSRNENKIIRAVGMNERLRMLRYKGSEGHLFHSHNDAVFARGPDQGERSGETSFVSVQIYLNQKFKGGCTRFHGRGRHLDVKPRTGSILIFEHGVLHEGEKVTHGKKYMVRTDIMYSISDSVGGGFTSAAMGTTLTQQL